jgi:hypothetical protein
MSNFGMIFERMESDKIKKKEESDRMSIEAIKDGLSIDDDFWKNFIMILNNPENLGQLLGVSPVKISTWYGKIKTNLEKYLTNTDYEDIKKLKKRRMIDTSDFDEYI